MTKYIICEFFSSGGATLYENPSDQSVTYVHRHIWKSKKTMLLEPLEPDPYHEQVRAKNRWLYFSSSHIYCNITLQKKKVYVWWNDSSKRFTICHILYIQKPKDAFLISCYFTQRVILKSYFLKNKYEFEVWIMKYESQTALSLMFFSRLKFILRSMNF